MLTAERLRELFAYDPQTGEFTRLGAGPAVSRVPNGDGYLRLCIDYVRYQQHRLAWLYVHGEWPREVIDHINGNGADNRLENLRACTVAENTRNRKRKRDSKSPLKGIFRRPDGKWGTCIKVNRRGYHLGVFDTPEEAHAAYCLASARLHGEYGSYV